MLPALLLALLGAAAQAAPAPAPAATASPAPGTAPGTGPATGKVIRPPTVGADGKVSIDVEFAAAKDNHPVPYEIAAGHIVFRAIVAGREVWCLLDNRIDHSALDVALARAVGLPLAATKPMVTSTGSLDAYRVADVAFTVPGTFDTRTAMVAVDMDKVAHALGRPVQAVLGADFIGHLTLLVDPGSHQMRMGPSGAAKPGPAVPVATLTDDRPHVALTIGGKPVALTVDLGSDATLTLTPDAWARVGDPKATLTDHTVMHAEGIPYIVKSARLPQVSIAGIALANVATNIYPVLPGDGDGFVGLGLLGRFSFALDITQRRLWLIPHLPGPEAAKP